MTSGSIEPKARSVKPLYILWGNLSREFDPFHCSVWSPLVINKTMCTLFWIIFSYDSLIEVIIIRPSSPYFPPN
nr:hypothetical protein Iba_chr09aCG0520 [Ipomoea batatas]GMD36586.1 hypothetical protein Iba_chr09eCG1360 [Ipomoea batatas]